MIPASYLYKEAYRRQWGEDFVRPAGKDTPQRRVGGPPHALLRAIRRLGVRIAARTTQTKGTARPAGTAPTPCCPVLPA